MSHSIAEQLKRLRRDGGAGAWPDDHAEPLAARIERLRRKPRASAQVDRLLGGRWACDGVLLIESEQAVGWPSSDAGFRDLPVSLAGFDWLFVDTETTGLSGGVGTSIFLFGAGQVREGKLCLRQFLLARPGAEAEFWRLADAEIRSAATVVSYNGKAFDWPLITARRRLCRREGLDPADHLDLLHWIRRAFADRWGDCRLTTCERQLLGFQRRDDLPGSFAPEVYREFLQTGRVERLARIVEHHRLDVLNLARILPLVGQVYRRPERYGANAVAIARWWRQRGCTERAVAILERDGTCAARRELGEIYRRDGRWSAARTTWEGLADSGDPVALEALAKYHEHRKRAPERALEYCRRLIEMRPQEPRHRHRLARLVRKTGAQT